MKFFKTITALIVRHRRSAAEASSKGDADQFCLAPTRFRIREGIKKNVFFGISFPNLFTHPPTPGFLWDLGKRKVKFGSKKAIFGAIWFFLAASLKSPGHCYWKREVGQRGLKFWTEMENCRHTFKSSCVSNYQKWTFKPIWILSRTAFKGHTEKRLI